MLMLELFHVIVGTCTMLFDLTCTMLLFELVPCYCWNLNHVNVGTCSTLLLELAPCYLTAFVPCYC